MYGHWQSFLTNFVIEAMASHEFIELFSYFFVLSLFHTLAFYMLTAVVDRSLSRTKKNLLELSGKIHAWNDSAQSTQLLNRTQPGEQQNSDLIRHNPEDEVFSRNQLSILMCKYPKIRLRDQTVFVEILHSQSCCFKMKTYCWLLIYAL